MRHWPSDRVGKAKRDVCVWKKTVSDFGDNSYETDCGYTSSSEFTLEECEYKFCPWCGKRLEQKGGDDERD